MVRAWVGSRNSDVGAPQGPASELDRQRAVLLETRADHARRSAMSAMACGNWAVAAQWEEQRLISEDELATLRMGAVDRPRSEAHRAELHSQS